ncbi:MAG: superoxide dismutase [Candidatus Latescibacteria bacterium]|nr:superoxide dismutase [Candidatus Latescibacterota bacterium]
MRKILILSLWFFSSLVFFASSVFAHCEIPCGIYEDTLRVRMIEEDITTVEKAMKMIVDLSQQTPQNFNQIVRWVNNKEHHADDIRHIVTQYFMTQRVKPTDKTDAKYADYVNQLALLHQMMVYSMKAKQTTDLANVEKLRSLLSDFKTAYFGQQEKEHKH